MRERYERFVFLLLFFLTFVFFFLSIFNMMLFCFIFLSCQLRVGMCHELSGDLKKVREFGKERMGAPTFFDFFYFNFFSLLLL